MRSQTAFVQLAVTSPGPFRFADADGNTVTLTAPRMVDQAAAQAWVSHQITGDFEVPEGFPLDPTRN